MKISISAQRALIWWGLSTLVIFAISIIFLIRMVPLPPATLDAQQVAAIYQANSLGIRIGAVICSWTAGFMVPLALVISVQMARIEDGLPIWSFLQFAGGCLMSMFFVFPPVIWGIAAFSPDRPAEITLVLHEMANLTLVTTDQYFIFQFVAIVVAALGFKRNDALSPFPRWYGYHTLWTAFMLELGAFGFLPRTGPFAWNGLFVFWSPLVVLGFWFLVTNLMLLGALRRQALAAQD